MLNETKSAKNKHQDIK